MNILKLSKATTTAALAAALALVATCVAAPSATANDGGRSISYRGAVIIGNCTMTSLEIDENGVWHAECDGIPPSVLVGDFTGATSTAPGSQCPAESASAATPATGSVATRTPPPIPSPSVPHRTTY